MQNWKGHKVMHTKTKTNTEPHKQWGVQTTINQQQKNRRPRVERTPAYATDAA